MHLLRMSFYGGRWQAFWIAFSLNFFLLYFSVVGEQRKKLETALLGKRAQFQCNVQSSDASEVTLWWQFGGQNLTKPRETEAVHHHITVSKSASGAVTSELVLDQVDWNDEGTYSCLAKEVGSEDAPTQQDIMLDIYGKFVLHDS